MIKKLINKVLSLFPIPKISPHLLDIQAKAHLDAELGEKRPMKESYHQKAEIRELKAEIERLQKAIQVQEVMLGNQDYTINKARIEATTKVVDRFKDVVVSKYDYTDIRVFEDLDRVAKELKEGYQECTRR